MEEIWKDIPELNGVYQCSNYGNVRRINKDPRCKKYKNLKLQIRKDGYVSVNPTLNYRKQVHRIVAQLFIPNPENKPCINHIDFNIKNNCFNNLEWCTPKENTHHSLKHGRLKGNNKSVIDIITNQKYKNIKTATIAYNLPYKYACSKIKEKGYYLNLIIA
jgi:hypothetical protein